MRGHLALRKRPPTDEETSSTEGSTPTGEETSGTEASSEKETVEPDGQPEV